jgi:hypothetical protein
MKTLQTYYQCWLEYVKQSWKRDSRFKLTKLSKHISQFRQLHQSLLPDPPMKLIVAWRLRMLTFSTSLTLFNNWLPNHLPNLPLKPLSLAPENVKPLTIASLTWLWITTILITYHTSPPCSGPIKVPRNETPKTPQADFGWKHFDKDGVNGFTGT